MGTNFFFFFLPSLGAFSSANFCNATSTGSILLMGLLGVGEGRGGLAAVLVLVGAGNEGKWLGLETLVPTRPARPFKAGAEGAERGGAGACETNIGNFLVSSSQTRYTSAKFFLFSESGRSDKRLQKDNLLRS
ncbi:hypothetical protein GEMRC1_002829 [Eukaryota sp. GEM-RC1]